MLSRFRLQLPLWMKVFLAVVWCLGLALGATTPGNAATSQPASALGGSISISSENISQWNISASGSVIRSRAASAAPSESFDPAEVASQVAYLVNQERVRNGLLPLKAVSNLTVAAQAHSQDMALNDFFNHTGSNGSSLATRLIAAGYVNWIGGGENIAAGFDTAEAVVAGWMGSTGHRNNILNAVYRESGVGFYDQVDDQPDVRLPDGSLGGPYEYYWTQDFGARSGVYPVIINLEAPATDNPQVTLAIHGQGWATQMQVSNRADFAGAGWEAFSSSKTWTLTQGNGLRTVYVKLRSSYNVEVVSSDDIEVTGQVDAPTPTPIPTPTATPSPTPSPSLPPAQVTINDGQPYSAQSVVTLSLELPGGARKVEASNDPAFAAAQLLPPQSRVEWSLDAGQPGRQVVYVRYRDSSGQLSPVASASVVYDPNPPSGHIAVIANNGLALLVSVQAYDGLSGVSAMAVALSPEQLTWQPYLTAVKVPLPTSGQGSSPVVFARFRDQAGNESPIFRSDELRTFVPLTTSGW